MDVTQRLGVQVYESAYRFLQAVRRRGTDRGDVPGWVMVTLMSAILVIAILVPFRSEIVPAINNAIDKVISQGD